MDATTTTTLVHQTATTLAQQSTTTLMHQGPDWLGMVAALVAGFGGAIIGAISIFFVEVWKQVLEFRVACRIVRYEVYDNIQAVDAALCDPAAGPTLKLREDGWAAGRSKLASVMSEGNWNPFATSYRDLPRIRRVLSSLSIPISSTDRMTLEVASKDFGALLGPLAEFEAKSRMQLFAIVLRGRIDDYP